MPLSPLAPVAARAREAGHGLAAFNVIRLENAESFRLAAEVVKAAHELGVSVEAELGEVGGKDGVHDPSARTDPADAARFVADTGVDLMAVAVGSSHAMTERTAALDEQLISAIAAEVPVPLVLHGSSGVADENIQAAIRAGMTKINVSTHLNKVYTGAVREFLEANPTVVDTRKWMKAGREAGTGEAERLIRLFKDAAQG
ncbi:class II fructose-bisphosphate aldolase [Brachybacterium muris]|uniref:class II fructose-bisphosphate aldolase n=1 Tax=Brachybacterium muris TaxID=219301 RepID=UPI00223C4EF6|nr:class II fructose-bisphosphate aldolase [Brachybacterium muris]MCT2178403.1 class II fructose-bisphosphate aldolase [Brachybacterium muris]MCT2262135.1 class II fructose-bisphosphate aldolase [Brachybacterium muris]